MAAAFVGSWKLTESEKFDDFLKELGVSEYQTHIVKCW